jgi:hypothetical protein
MEEDPYLKGWFNQPFKMGVQLAQFSQPNYPSGIERQVDDPCYFILENRRKQSFKRTVDGQGTGPIGSSLNLATRRFAHG